jgi:hypothetical protein
LVPSVAGLLRLSIPLWKWDSGFRLHSFAGKPPGEGTREAPSCEPLGQSLYLRADIAPAQTQFGEGGACGPLFGPLCVLLADA